MNKQNAADFSQGSIGSRIMAQAIPLSLAEIVQLLYNLSLIHISVAAQHEGAVIEESVTERVNSKGVTTSMVTFTVKETVRRNGVPN